MNKLSIEDYLKDPCFKSSLPYWKCNQVVAPSNFIILHDKDFIAEKFEGYNDQKYFRIIHNLSKISLVELKDISIEIVNENNIDYLANNINACYDYLKVSVEQLLSLRGINSCTQNVWILLKEDKKGIYIGSGIAILDTLIGELSLEWIQVLPNYRKNGYGTFIVNYLLNSVKGIAKFATVSGRIDDPNCPEKLYRKCGFTGDDIWHILSKKD